MKKILKVCLCFLLLSSCQEKKEITVSGYIKDETTKKPIKDAKVTILCWYDAGWDKTDYQTVDLITTSNGFFKAKFDEGYKVAIASIAKGCSISMKEQFRGENKILTINMDLKRDSLNSDLSRANLREYIVYNGTN